MDDNFECLKRIQVTQKKLDVTSFNVRFFLKVESCIRDPYDFCNFVKGIFDYEQIITPELSQSGCTCTRRELYGQNFE